MTFLATFLAFAAAISITWLATQRSSRGHECSCSRSHRVMTEYERAHPRSFRPATAARSESLVLIRSSALVRKAEGGKLTSAAES